MDFTSFLTSLGTSFLIFLVLMIVFAFLSSKPGNNVVYFPNRILKGLEPSEGGPKSRNPFSWIKEAMSSSERDIVTMSGVDTAVYFVFLTTGFSLFPFFYQYICLLHNFLFVEAPRIKLGYGFIGSFWSCSPIKIRVFI